MQTNLFNMTTHGAEFSSCRKYRYSLWRHWDYRGPESMAMFIGLNPSTADEIHNDPTVRRCIKFVRDWGYGGLAMMNAYAYRATDPKEMKAQEDPVGPGNDLALLQWAGRVSLIVAAWGTHCAIEREEHICHTINKTIYCLGTTKDSRPKHPLYLRADLKPRIFWTP